VLDGDRVAQVCAILAILIVVVALLAPWLSPFPSDASDATHPSDALLPPSAEHSFGTDQVGRDLLTRVMYGARTSLLIVVCVLVSASVVGVLLGITAGFIGGITKIVIMRITDVFLAFPALLLAVALAAVLRPSLRTVIVAIAVTWWPWYCRLAASTAASISRRGYVESAACLGVSRTKIIIRHVLPNSVTPVLVQLSLDVGGIILTAAALSYLSLGVQEPTSEWGLMVQQGQSLFLTNWWVVAFPGAAILVTALVFNLLGESLRSALDPRQGLR
jgi:peptide/nickel transport system permease protein